MLNWWWWWSISFRKPANTSAKPSLLEADHQWKDLQPRSICDSLVLVRKSIRTPRQSKWTHLHSSNAGCPATHRPDFGGAELMEDVSYCLPHSRRQFDLFSLSRIYHYSTIIHTKAYNQLKKIFFRNKYPNHSYSAAILEYKREHILVVLFSNLLSLSKKNYGGRA